MLIRVIYIYIDIELGSLIIDSPPHESGRVWSRPLSNESSWQLRARAVEEVYPRAPHLKRAAGVRLLE